jgi:hypothetical protein
VLPHVWNDRTDHAQYPIHVDLKHVLHLFNRDVFDRSAHSISGIIDQDINVPKAAHNFLRGAGNRGRIGDIQRQL